MSSWADVWTEEVDDSTGAYYYYNSVTGASQWERPVDFVESVPETATVHPGDSHRVSSKTSTTAGSEVATRNRHGQLANRTTGSREDTANITSASKSKPKKYASWTKTYLDEGMKPYTCILCSKANRAANSKCEQCGKHKPFREPLENLAVVMMQCAVRCFLAKCCIGVLVLKTYDKVWDNHKKDYVYRNKLTQQQSHRKPRFLLVDDIPLSKVQASLRDQREEREAAQADREKKWAVEHKQAAKAAAAAVIQAWDDLWAAYFKEARKTKQLIFCWKGVDRFHDAVYDMTYLTCVRLIGNKIRNLPAALFTQLPLLEKLSFSNNEIIALPPEIGNLTGLNELNLIKNRLVTLPDEFCELKQLVTLELSSNNLRELPERFGALTGLRGTLSIENNCLERLPESFGLLQITGLRLTRNQLTGLPSSVKMMVLLENLQLNLNRLDDFPLVLTHLPDLAHLSLCKNEIPRVPHRIGLMSSLKNLWLDWNDIEELPTEVSELAALHTFSLNGNPMRSPTMDIIAQGVDVTREWCRQRASFNTHRKRVQVIKSLQNVFRAIIETGNVDPDLAAYFDAEAHPKEATSAGSGTWRDSMGGGYYSFANDVLFKEIVPRLQRVANRLPPSDGKLQRAANFEWEPDEVADALAHCEDSCGPLAHTGLKLMFRKCRCMKGGRRRVCVPPRKGYLCRRGDAALLKKQIVTDAEYREELSHHQELEKVDLAERIARSVAMEYIKSDDGQKNMTIKALERSAAAMYADRKRVYIEKQTMKAQKKFDYECAQRDKMLAALEASRKKRVDEINAEKTVLSDKLERLRGWEAKKCQEKFEQCERDLQNIPEDDEIELLKEQMDEAPGLFETEMVAVRDGEGFEQRQSRQKLTRKQKKFAKEIRGQVEEEYCQVLIKEAAHVARTEFKLMRKIGSSWTQGALRRVFLKWAEWAKDNVEKRLILAAFEEETAVISMFGEENKKKLLAMEAAKWEEGYDAYEERYFYTHTETGEVVWDERPLDREFVLRVK
jgi:Leucine-rich repeat (LRR) protein